jgi:preprotein translocase subunit YajC
VRTVKAAGVIIQMNIDALFLLQSSSGPALPGLVMFAPIILLIGYMFYSQQRKQKKWQSLLGDLKTGDRVTTSGGLRGTIVALKDDYLHLRVPPDNLRMEVSRASIVSVTTPDDPQSKPTGK